MELDFTNLSALVCEAGRQGAPLSQLVLEQQARQAEQEPEVLYRRMRDQYAVCLLYTSGIGLRGYAQRDPVVEYRIEGFNMFDAMVESIQEDTTRMLLTLELRREQPIQREQVAKPTSESGASDGSIQKQPVRKVVKIGRNDPCPCGSGLKWKKCTCKQYHPDQNGTPAK